VIFVFKSTYLTFKAERTLRAAGIPCKLSPSRGTSVPTVDWRSASAPITNRRSARSWEIRQYRSSACGSPGLAASESPPSLPWFDSRSPGKKATMSLMGNIKT
jgi:hypothetical protein